MKQRSIVLILAAALCAVALPSCSSPFGAADPFDQALANLVSQQAAGAAVKGGAH